jgi:hypothetical protein
MTLDEAETRLSQERAYLIVAEHSGNPVSIALAQTTVANWEQVVRIKRLEESPWTQ